jgi:hypothetical protein
MSDGGRGPVVAGTVVVAGLLLLVVVGVLGFVVLLDPVP